MKIGGLNRVEVGRIGKFGDCGIIDQPIYPSPARQRRLGDTPAIGVHTDIATDQNCFSAGRFAGCEDSAGLTLATAVIDDDASAFRRQHFGTGCADAGGRTGNDADGTCDFHFPPSDFAHGP